MARKNLKEDPPAVSSEEESEVETTDEEKEETEQKPNDNEDEAGAEEEGDSSEEEDDEKEEENGRELKKQPRSDAGDSSDSESEPATASDYIIKPIVSKPMPNSPAAKPKKSAPAQKRPAAVSDPNPNDPKKKKKKKAIRGGKLWSHGDVLVILKSIIHFKEEKGLKPSADPGSFYELVKSNLEVEKEVSQHQLMEKVIKLKAKFKKNVTEKGYAHVFTKPHQSESFELCKNLWGAEVNGGASTSKKNKSKKESASGMKGRETVVAIGASAAVEQDVGKQEKAVVNEGNADKNKEKVKNKKVLVNEGNEENADKNKEKVVSEGNVVNKKEKKKNKVVMNADPDQYPCLMKYLCDEIQDSVVASIGHSMAKELEDKWMKLEVEEEELLVKKSDLIEKFRFEELELYEKKLYLMIEQVKLLKDSVHKE